MNVEATRFGTRASTRGYTESISRIMAVRFAAPVAALWTVAAAALWAGGSTLPTSLIAIGLIVALAASLGAVYLLAGRIARAVAIPADALAGSAAQDNRFILAGSPISAANAWESLNQIEVEFAALGTALMRRFSRDAQLTAELSRAKEDAQTANVAKSQFLADMSHQLRTPLNAIIGYATLLQEDALSAERHEEMEDLDRILHASRTLLELINYVIDLSRMESGKTSLQRTILDIGSLATSVVSSFDLEQHGNGNRLEVELSPEIGIMVGDGSKIRQCLINLVGNALKFTRDGDVRLKIGSVLHSGVECIEFTVTDTGIGMTPDQAANLFQDASGEADARYNPASGPKLGLAITRRLATLMGGTIAVETRAGEGSVFTLIVPREMARTVPVDERPAIEKQAVVQSITGKRALIIDDEPSAIDIVGRWLTRVGYTIISADNGEEGLRLARSERPDLIILDIFMPGRSGHEVLAEIRADESISSIPVIVLTVLDDRPSVLKSGASDCLMKPVQPQQLEQVLDVYSRRLDGEILVIEDDPDSGSIIRRTAAQIGLSARVARDGEEGLAMIREKRPAAVVLDLSLPGMSGFQVLEKLAADPELKRIPVIIVSGREISVLEHQVITKAGGIFHPKGHASPREIAQSLRLVVGS